MAMFIIYLGKYDLLSHLEVYRRYSAIWTGCLSYNQEGKVQVGALSREEPMSKNRPHTVCHQPMCVSPQNVTTLTVQCEYGNYISRKENCFTQNHYFHSRISV